MRLLILGFGPLAREITSRVKHFPEYGYHKQIVVYHIFVRRNSLSYGKDLVVEILDPQGDGYRTYKDGFQALDNYSTTVSSYTPWLLEESANGSFHMVVDCTNKSAESDELIANIVAVSKDGCDVIPANLWGADKVIEFLRNKLDGGKPWEPVVYSKEFLDSASELWENAQGDMAESHLNNRKRDIAEMGHPDKSRSKLGYARISIIPDNDLDILQRFVINNEDHPDHRNSYRREYYDDEHKCLVIEHDLLTSFFGWHHVEQTASRAFCNPYLEIESAKYVKYDSEDSTHLPEETAEYVIESVLSGTLKVLPTNEPDFVKFGQPHIHLEFSGTDKDCSYPYKPEINPPSDKIVEAGLETLIFTFRDSSAGKAE